MHLHSSFVEESCIAIFRFHMHVALEGRRELVETWVLFLPVAWRDSIQFVAGCMAALQAEHFLQEVKGMQPNTATHWGSEADAKPEKVNGSSV